MQKQNTERQIELRDGRKLGYAEYGAGDVTPIIYFHGFPGSRLDWRLFGDHNDHTASNIRVIAPDRPGFGLSDYQYGRRFIDWAADVVELADKLDIEKFSVLGISGGGPYAAVCACSIVDRIVSCGIVCSMGPREAPGMQSGLSWTLPGMNRIKRSLVLRLTKMGLDREPNRFVSQSKEAVSEPDRNLLEEPKFAEVFIQGMKEAFRNGIRGASQEAKLLASPWGFGLSEIATGVYLWHGGRDHNVPSSVGRYMAESIPSCQANILEEEGHFTLPRNHLREILSTLVG